MLISSWLSSLQSKLQGRSRTATRRSRKLASSQHVASESLEVRVLPTLSFTTTLITNNHAFDVKTGDFNGDGKIDLVTPNYQSVAVNGSYLAPFTGGNVSVLLGNGNGTFQTPIRSTVGSLANPSCLSVADFNGDGKADLVAANSNGYNLGVLLGNGNGTFAAPTFLPNFLEYPDSVTTGDFNMDGKPDIATGDRTGLAFIFLGNGDGTFATAATYAAGGWVNTVAVGDFNGDSKPDIVTGNAYPSMRILLNNGDGTFSLQTTISTSHSHFDITVADFNGDGKADLASASPAANKMSVWLGDGAGSFSLSTTRSVPFYAGGTAAADFNGDGKLDLVGGSKGIVMLGNGDGTFAANAGFTGTLAYTVAVEDFNSDGKPDFVTAYENDGSSTGQSGNNSGLAVSLNTTVPANTPPTVAANNAAVSANEGGVATNTGTFNDAQGRSTVALTATVGGVAFGTVTKNDANGTWSWSVNAADGPAGPFTVTIKATDTQNASANATFTYAVNNVVPTISLNGNATVNEGSLYTLNLGAVTDPGTDAITSYQINWGDGTNSGLIVGNPANTSATHTFADGPSTQTNNVTVTDEDGNFVAGSLSVQVLNVAPTASEEAVTFPENSSAQVVDVLANDSDPAGANDPLSVTSVNGTGTTGTVSLNAGQVSYLADGFFEALGAGETAIDSFEYSISDGDGGTNTATVTVFITGENDAPTATGVLSDVAVNQNAADSIISLAGLFQDVDATDSLTITAASSSSGLVTAGVSGNSLTLDYQANQSGTATITVTATDGSGASVSLTFEVAVISPAQQGNVIIQLIQLWKTDGKINAGVANSMIVKVVNALKSYGNGNITAAGNHLCALKNEINAKVTPDGLTALDATLAINLIDDLFDSMTV